MEVLLTVGEVADIRNCSHRHVQILAKRGKLKHQMVEVSGRGQACHEYRIPLTALDSSEQIKYKRKQRKLTETATNTQYLSDVPPPVDFQQLTDKERGELTFWLGIINEWKSYRQVNKDKPKAVADQSFVDFVNARVQADLLAWAKSKALRPAFEPKEIGLKTLYRKAKDYKDKGEMGLISKAGKHGNHTRKMTQEIQDIFEFYYLDEQNKKAVTECRTLVGQELERRYGIAPQLPGIKTFTRAVERIPYPVRVYFREGEKAYIGRCAPYITKMYEDLEPNDIWVADGHTFDVNVKDKEGNPLRLYLSAFMDVRTRKFMGWIVCSALNGDNTIYALKRGVEKYGSPKAIQIDNGKEYLFKDFSGDAGFRKTAKRKDDEFVPPTILEELGIDIRVGLPTNARGKAIERAFLTIKETFSKMFKAYTGGSVAEKPEKLNTVIKNGELQDIDEFTTMFDQYIQGIYNQRPHTGEGMNGSSPNEVYAKLLTEKRIVRKDQLPLMFMRYSKGTLKVGKGGGITLKVWGQKLQYEHDDLFTHHYGEDVYVRYEPENMNKVRVFNTNNQFICEAQLKTKMSQNANKEELKAITAANKKKDKFVKEYKKNLEVEAQSELDAMLAQAAKGIEIPEQYNANILYNDFKYEEQADLLQAVGGEAQIYHIDKVAAAKRARQIYNI